MQMQDTKKVTRTQQAVNYAIVATAPILFASAAHAEVDTASAITQLGYALAAVAALGAAKLAPAALTWVWSLVTRTASRS